MGEPIKDYVAKQLLKKRFHFKCPCIVPLDFEGEVVSYEIKSGEIIFVVSYKDKLIHLSLNHPNLTIESI